MPLHEQPLERDDTFQMSTFPVAENGDQTPAIAATPNEPSAEAKLVRKNRILIVDDDVRLSQLTRRILEKSGLYEIMVVNESPRAYESALHFQPSLVLLDIDMPEKDGGEVAREMGEDPTLRDVPVIFLTGLVSRSEAGQQQLESGGKSYLAKPVEPHVLLEAVGKMLTLHPSAG